MTWIVKKRTSGQWLTGARNGSQRTQAPPDPPRPDQTVVPAQRLNARLPPTVPDLPELHGVQKVQGLLIGRSHTPTAKGLTELRRILGSARQAGTRVWCNSYQYDRGLRATPLTATQIAADGTGTRTGWRPSLQPVRRRVPDRVRTDPGAWTRHRLTRGEYIGYCVELRHTCPMHVTDSFTSTVAVTIPVLMLTATVELGGLADTVNKQILEEFVKLYEGVFGITKLLAKARKASLWQKIALYPKIVDLLPGGST